jgi:hypothetical protein
MGRQTLEENLNMSEPDNPSTWPDLAIGLYDRLTGRGAEITYEFQDMRIMIPSGTGPKVEHAEWVVSGTVKIRTKDSGTRPN